MDHDDIHAAYTSGGFRPRLVNGGARKEEQPPLILHAATLPAPDKIPPRPWLFGTQLIRGFVTVLVAPGGTGKSAYAMAVAASVASHEEFLHQHIFASGPTCVLNLEDPMDELNRRLAAIMLRHELGAHQLAGRFFLHSGEDRAITIASPDPDGFSVAYPDEEAITDQISQHHIILLVVDPYAESHSLEENSNPDMVKAAAAWRRIARATNCAILLVHHVRKGVVTDIDAARGAKALTDSARVGMILSPMSPEDAEEFGIPDDERWAYVRLDDAKVNLAPKASKARWLRLEQVSLGNATADYPHGDKVAAIAVWEPALPFKDLSSIECNEALDIIAAGPEPGMLFTPSKRGGTNRWVGQILVDRFDRNVGQAKSIVRLWFQSGLLEEIRYTHPTQHRETPGVRVNDARRPT